MKILITGGCGFIGSNFIRYMLDKYRDCLIFNLDKLTYAGKGGNLKDKENNRRYRFIQGDICDAKVVEKIVPDCEVIVNFAAESHVDRSILCSDDFVRTNVFGTHVLLEAAKRHNISRFVQISCYDEKTRALTTRGLKTYKELKAGDLVFSLNPRNLKIEIKPIEKIIVQTYQGKMVRFNNQRIDLFVTPNHNMFILNTSKKNKRLLIESAEKAMKRSIFYMPQGHWVGKNDKYFRVNNYGKVLTNDMLYLLGIFIGDGFTAYQEKAVATKTGLPRKEYLKMSRNLVSGRFKIIDKMGNHESIQHNYRIFFDIPENDKCRKKVEATLHNLGIKYHSHKGKAGTHLYFASKEFMELFDQCGKGAHHKCIPSWALAYSQEHLIYLFDGLMDSDGHSRKIYHTVSERLVSDFCELCIKLGLKPSIHKRYSKSFIKGRKIEGASYYIFVASTAKSIRRHRNKIVDYNGDIWCLKVKDNKNFLVERGGRFDFCGNTDEVYGSIKDGSFTEKSPILPNSPYSATKAAADLLARSYFVTHGLPVIITRSSNNFGPWQYPEKVIPLFITNLLEGKKVPLYGDGLNVRDWLFVLDNCAGIDLVMRKGKTGEVYNIGGGSEITNLRLTHLILKKLGKGKGHINYVPDRAGHDRRYSLNCAKIKKLGFKPKYNFGEALDLTVLWYKNNKPWWKKLKSENAH